MRTGNWRARAGLWCLPLVVLVGCFPGALPAPVDVGDGLEAEYLTTGINGPAVLACATDGRIFVAERDTGLIRVIKDGALLATPFASLPVNTAGERGLRGIALHPQFENNGRIYVFYSRSDSGAVSSSSEAIVDNRVVYLTAADDGDVAEGGEVFVASLPVSSNAARIGGRIAFGPDRKLYVALGDMTSDDFAQDPNNPYGKVLRYNDDGTIPDDNPWDGSAVFAVGFRDPQAIAFDPVSDYAFVLERLDPVSYEVDRVQAKSNYGWPDVVGVADTTAELAFVAEHPYYGDALFDTGLRRVEFAGLAFNPSGKYGTQERELLFYGDASEARITSVKLSVARDAAESFETFASRIPVTMDDIQFTPTGTLIAVGDGALLRINVVP